MFLKVFLCFCVFRVFVKIFYFLFLTKKLLEGFLRVSRDLALSAKVRMKKKSENTKIQTESFMRKNYPRKLISASVAFSRVTLREAYLRKARVFSL